jgi:hypothetical protein
MRVQRNRVRQRSALEPSSVKLCSSVPPILFESVEEKAQRRQKHEAETEEEDPAGVPPLVRGERAGKAQLRHQRGTAEAHPEDGYGQGQQHVEQADQGEPDVARALPRRQGRQLRREHRRRRAHTGRGAPSSYDKLSLTGAQRPLARELTIRTEGTNDTAQLVQSHTLGNNHGSGQ